MTLAPDPRQIADPFGEHTPLPLRRCARLLGADVEFASHSEALMAAVEAAYADLPAHDLGAQASLHIELRLQAGDADWQTPPPPRMLGGAGLLGVALDAGNLALALPDTARGLVSVTPAMLAHPYHLRYELLEFVVFTLASRTLGLLPLHAGCVGAQGQGALLMGESGAGKSTASLAALAEGLEFLTEDACFVHPGSLLATGIANFLHLRVDGLGWTDEALRERVQAAPVIHRRSGVAKHEVDLRGGWARLAAAPLQLRHLVFTSAEPAPDGQLLTPLDAAETRERLRVSQPLAALRPGWSALEAAGLHGWRLRRGGHPRDAARAIRRLFMP